MTVDIRVTESPVKTYGVSDRPCAGGLEKSQGLSRKLRSLKDARVKMAIPSQTKEKVFDPSAWYVAEVKRFSELKCREMLSRTEDFDYQVEAYVASQVVLGKKGSSADAIVPVKEKIVIHGKIFIRVAQEHRIDVLQKCHFLTRYMKDPSLSLTPNNFTDFARVPDIQIQRLRELLKLADGPVVYSEIIPQQHDNIQVIGGQLAKGTLFKNLKGEISMTDGRKYATVVLDGLGCFKFKIPIKDIAKVRCSNK